MAVLFSTLGFTPKLALAPLRGTTSYSEVHVFYGPGRAESEDALAAVRAACTALGVALRVRKVPDPFDYTSFLHAFAEAARRVGDAEVHVNASGGTRVGIMAATIFCFTNDIPLLYYDEYGTADGKQIPLKAFRNLDRLGATPRAILRHLQNRGPADMGTLATRFSLAPSTVTEHVQTLTDAGTVTVERDGKRRIVRLLPDLQTVELEVQ